MTKNALFNATLMPDNDWWSDLWPDPKSVLMSVGVKSDMQVVDLCCGNGHFTKPMCELVNVGGVWALDLDADLLSEAKKACEMYSNFNAVLGDARELCTKIEAPVDFIFIANTFHGIPDKVTFSQSVSQSLKPGGVFAVINWHSRPREQTTVLNLPRGPDTELRMQPQQVSDAVEPAGFKTHKVIDVGPYHYAVIFFKR